MSEENTLPEGWCWVRLESLTHRIGDVDHKMPSAVAQGIPYISTKNFFGENDIDFKEAKRISNEDYIALSRKIKPEKGDILLSRYGTIGEVRKVPADIEFQASYSVAIIKTLSQPNLTNYLIHALRSEAVQTQIKRDIRATAQPDLGLEYIRQFQIPLAPLSEQGRIVAAIEQQFTRLDVAIAALKRTKAKLKRYRASVLKAAVEGKLTEVWRAEHPTTEHANVLLERILVERRAKWEADLKAKGKDPVKGKYVEAAMPDVENLPGLPEEWCWARVEQISQIQGGIQKQPSRAPKENAFPYLRVANVLRGRLDLSVIERMEVFRDELNTLRLEVGDMLIVEGNGSRTEIGRSALWKGEIKDCIHQNHIIRVRLDTVLPKYLDFYWNSPTGNKRVMDVAASTSGLYTLSVGKISRLPAPLPPLLEQQEIVSEVERRLSIVTQLEATVEADLKRAERLRQSILKEAFAGRLVPQDPNDEPASVLLERIHKEREGQKQGPIKKARAIKTISAPRISDVEPMQIDASEMEQMDLWASIGSRE